MSVERIYGRMVKSEPFLELGKRIEAGEKEIPIRGLPGSLSAMAVAFVGEQVEGTLLVVTATEERAEELRGDLERVMDQERVGIFPAWGGSAYDGRSPHLDVMGLRLEALDQMQRETARRAAEWASASHCALVEEIERHANTGARQPSVQDYQSH